ncbi:MAG: DUF4402 domain-containing protein, partial [Pseudomonadota bacterium]
ILAASAAMVFAAPAMAQQASSDAGAIIVAPLQVTNTQPLYFGSIVPSTTASDTVAVATDGTRTCGAELTCLTNDHTPAIFDVDGGANLAYTVSVPTSVDISNAGGDTMTVNAFSALSTDDSQYLLNATGDDAFNVGGTLTVAANQASGEYTGTFVVTVSYQ